MTNGEKIKEIFQISQVDEGTFYAYVWLPNQDAVEINIDWWNAEYKKPTTKIDCEHTDCNNCVNHKYCDYEPTTKNDLVTLTFSKGTLKYSCKDYVVYKKDWLRSHYGAEIDIMFGDSQYKESTTKNDLPHCQHTDEEIAKSFIEDVEAVKDQLPTTKNDLEVDCRSLEDIKKLVERKADALDGVMLDAGGVIIGLYFAIANDLPPVTPQEPKIGHWKDIPKYKDIAWQCSECGHFSTMKHNYCPNCGCKMVEPQESEGSR